MKRSLLILLFLFLLIGIIGFSIHQRNDAIRASVMHVGLRTPVFIFFKENTFLTPFKDTRMLPAYFRKHTRTAYEEHPSTLSLPTLPPSFPSHAEGMRARYWICMPAHTQCAETILFDNPHKAEEAFTTIQNILSSSPGTFSDDPYILTRTFTTHYPIRFYGGWTGEGMVKNVTFLILNGNVLFLYAGSVEEPLGAFALLNTTRAVIETPRWIRDTARVQTKPFTCI